MYWYRTPSSYRNALPSSFRPSVEARARTAAIASPKIPEISRLNVTRQWPGMVAR